MALVLRRKRLPLEMSMEQGICRDTARTITVPALEKTTITHIPHLF
jgi:hypothetical protein